MLYRRIALTAILLLPSAGFAASREIQELQRDIALLQEQVRNLQRSQDEKLAALTVVAQQAMDAASKANTAVAVLDSRIVSTLREQSQQVVGPVTGFGAKVDQLTTDVSALRESNADVVGRLGRLQQVLAELTNAVKTLQAPPPPPPSGGPGQAAAPVPPTVLYANAERDRLGGKMDLALQEYQDYLKNYGNDPQAPAAQYYIGEIYLTMNKPEDALAAFDAVLEHFSDNPKTPDAIFMKGQTLVRMRQPTRGAEEFRSLIKKYPSNSLSNQACSQLKQLGLSCNVSRSAATPSRSTTTSKKKRD